ncbi:MAG: hypothetical protein E6Q93_25410 [Burkholderiaceae bacterium]|nr:MAG: hypothetical protein E6Q93_25410 [Burkholderiaceae bacterium]
MGKLFKLREWLTVEEAARHLTSVLEEEVVAADVLRLGLEGHLTLSANFVNKAKARLGRVVPFKDVPISEMPNPRPGAEKGELLRYPRGLLLEKVDEITEETSFLVFDEAVVSIADVWDLAMLGSERLDIEHEFQSLTGGPAVELVCLEGTFVSRPDGQWAQLQDQLPDKEVQATDGRKQKVRGSYYPAGALPHDAPIVVRTGALAEFQARLLSPQLQPGASGESVGTRERDTLLKLVIGMAIGGYGYEPEAARSKTPGEIVADLAKRGIAVSDDTVRKYLKEAAATVLPRPAKS